MSVYKRGDVWWYGFNFAGRVYQESTKSKSKTLAKEAEKKRRRELEEAFNDTGNKRKARLQTISTWHLHTWKTTRFGTVRARSRNMPMATSPAGG